MSKTKEKHIVSNIKENFDIYFPDYKFFKTEVTLGKWRPDILASKENNIPCFIEVKHDRNDRDLLYEVVKGLDFVKKRHKEYEFIVVTDNVSERFVLDFLFSNNIKIYLYSTEELKTKNTLSIKQYTIEDFNKKNVLTVNCI